MEAHITCQTETFSPCGDYISSTFALYIWWSGIVLFMYETAWSRLSHADEIKGCLVSWCHANFAHTFKHIFEDSAKENASQCAFLSTRSANCLRSVR